MFMTIQVVRNNQPWHAFFLDTESIVHFNENGRVDVDGLCLEATQRQPTVPCMLRNLRSCQASSFHQGYQCMFLSTAHAFLCCLNQGTLAIVNEAKTAWQIRPHRPLLAV